MNNNAVPILDVLVSATNYSRTLQTIATLIQSKRRQYICVAAVHLIMECQKDPLLKAGVNRAGVVTPDGMPLVWLGKLYGRKKMSRVYGPTLTLKTCALAEKKGHRIFLLGGAKGQSSLVAEKLHQKFPQLKIVGNIDTPIRPFPKKMAATSITAINKSSADIVFVGLGCPLQEQWMIVNRTHLKPAVLIGVGAAFDFISGAVPQAPLYIQNAGFEWLFRLLQEPRRLAKRYTLINSWFIYKIIGQLMRDFLLR